MVKFDISTVASHIAIFLNGFLIWLIWKKSGKPLESYRKLLYLGAIFDFVFSIVIVLVAPKVVFSNDFMYYFVLIDGWIAYFGHPFDFWLTIFHVYLSYSSITVATVQYIYRFLLILWDYTLDAKTFCGFVILSLIVPSYFIYVFYVNFYPKPNEMEIYGPILLETKIIEKTDLKSFIVSFSAPPFEQLTFYSAAISIGSFGIILFCSVAVIFKLCFVKLDRKIQNQISIVLFCEALVPLLTMVIPLQFFAFLSQIYPWFPSVFSYIIAFSPLFNPIVKMIVISPFRRTIFSMLTGKRISTSVVGSFLFSKRNENGGILPS